MFLLPADISFTIRAPHHWDDKVIALAPDLICFTFFFPLQFGVTDGSARYGALPGTGYAKLQTNPPTHY